VAIHHKTAIGEQAQLAAEPVSAYADIPCVSSGRPAVTHSGGGVMLVTWSSVLLALVVVTTLTSTKPFSRSKVISSAWFAMLRLR